MFGPEPVPTLKHFYYRRAVKIMPSYLLALFIFGVSLSSLNPVSYKHGLLADLGLHLTFLHNLLPETRSSFTGVLWSLAVEVQFYYIFPLLAKAFRRFPWLTAAAMVAVASLFRAWAQHKPLEDFSQWNSLLPDFLDLVCSFAEGWDGCSMALTGVGGERVGLVASFAVRCGAGTGIFKVPSLGG